MTRASVLLLVLLGALGAQSRQGFGSGDQEWGFAEVRPGAHMFWWLYRATDPAAVADPNTPLLIWLQGGPGASGTGNTHINYNQIKGI